MTRVEVAKLLDLPVEERAEIARQLVESLPPDSIPDWHFDILRERIAEADANPEASIPWEQIESELWPRG